MYTYVCHYVYVFSYFPLKFMKTIINQNNLQNKMPLNNKQLPHPSDGEICDLFRADQYVMKNNTVMWLACCILSSALCAYSMLFYGIWFVSCF